VPAERRDRVRLAAEALAVAKADARARGEVPGRTDDSERTGAHAAGPGGGRARRDDPERLGRAIGGLLDQQGWQQRAAVGSVFGRWAEIVGPDLAAHTKPDAFTDGELAVIADSTAWATQVRLLAPQLVRRLNAELGDGTVRRVKVRGPAPPRQRGGWRVPGGRGPRDTYG
jgi:predicted nucleic acid-binding Zn ribbon protein